MMKSKRQECAKKIIKKQEQWACQLIRFCPVQKQGVFIHITHLLALEGGDNFERTAKKKRPKINELLNFQAEKQAIFKTEMKK